MGRRILTHRRGMMAVLALVVVTGVVVAAVLVANSPSPTKAAGAPRAAAGAATVERRDLVQTDTEAGTLSYANPQTVYDRLSGTVTWLPRVGQVIKSGGVLYRVNGAPVLLMNGHTPAYRKLSSADSDGADVLELNRNLIALGFNASGIVADDIWQPGTTLGVELLQESLGETATGSLALGKVVFLPGPQLISSVQGTLGATDNGGSSGQPASGHTDPPAPEFVSLQKPVAGSSTTATTSSTTSTSATTPTTTPTTPSTPTTSPPGHHGHPSNNGHPSHSGSQTPSLAALLALLKAESAQLKAEAAQLKAAQQQAGHGNGGNGGSGGGSGGGNSGHGNSGNSGSGNSGNSGNSGSGNGGNGGGGGNGGSGGSSGTAILQTTSTHLVVTVDLDASLQSEARLGERVTVQMPAGNTVNGRVSAVSAVAQSSSSSGNSGNGSSGNGSSGNGGSGNGGNSGNGNGGGSSSTVPVTITLSGRHTGAGLDEAAVSVSFAQRRARNVLSVPVTALLAVSQNNYAVQEAAAPHTRIPVNVGLFAAGFVQISGSGIHPGLQVTDSQG